MRKATTMTRRICSVFAVFGTVQIFANLDLSYGINNNAHILLRERSVEPTDSKLDKLLKALWFELPSGIGEIPLKWMRGIKRVRSLFLT